MVIPLSMPFIFCFYSLLLNHIILHYLFLFDEFMHVQILTIPKLMIEKN